jgi:hypothetical protein
MKYYRVQSSLSKFLMAAMVPEWATIGREFTPGNLFLAGTTGHARDYGSVPIVAEATNFVQAKTTLGLEPDGAIAMVKLPVVILLLSIGLCSASAQGGHLGTPQEQKACSRDASHFCRKQLGDDSSVQQCLQQNRTKLSRACKKVFESHGM